MSILNSRKNLGDITNDDVEGVNHINISKYSTTSIGKMLAPGYPFKFDSLIGTIGNIRNAMSYITIVNGPKWLLSKKKLTTTDIDIISKKKKVNLPNYWAIITYLIAARIMSDPALLSLIKNSNPDMIISTYNIYKDNSLGTTSRRIEMNYSISRYVAAVRLIFELIRNDNFNNESIIKLIQESKENKDVPLFEGAPFSITSDL